jgi:hypothetical protein
LVSGFIKVGKTKNGDIQGLPLFCFMWATLGVIFGVNINQVQGFSVNNDGSPPFVRLPERSDGLESGSS